MKAILAVVLLAIFVACTQARFAPWTPSPTFPTRPVFYDDAEADAEFWGAVARFAAPHVAKWAAGRLRRRDDVESDAEFFKKLGRWFKRNVTPENIQKGLDIYRSFRGGDDVQSDAAFFKKLGRWFKRNVTPENIQKGLDIYRTVRGGDAVESDSEIWGVVAPMAIKYGLSKLRRDDFESDSEFWGAVARFAAPHVVKFVSSKLRRRRDDIESDAQFFKKLGRWFKRNVTPENIQKGLDIYRTVRGGDNVLADQRNSFGFNGNVNNAGVNLGGTYSRSFNNGGNLNIGGNFGRDFGSRTNNWGVNAGYDRTWNGGRTSLGVTGNVGGSTGSRPSWGAGINFTHRW